MKKKIRKKRKRKLMRNKIAKKIKMERKKENKMRKMKKLFLFLGFFQNRIQHPCEVPILLFLKAFHKVQSIWTQEPTGRNISILVSMSLSPINLKCWILQNVMLYFVCEILLKLCVLNVKTRLLYYKAKLMLRLFPNVSKQGRMFLNLFYNII